jgi:hypothetical protein
MSMSRAKSAASNVYPTMRRDKHLRSIEHPYQCWFAPHTSHRLIFADHSTGLTANTCRNSRALCNVTKLGGWWNCTEAGWCRAAPDVAPPCLARPAGHLIVGIRIPSFARFKPSAFLAYPCPCPIREPVILVIRSSAPPCRARARERAPSHSHGSSASECGSVSAGTISLKAVFVASFLRPTRKSTCPLNANEWH